MRFDELIQELDQLRTELGAFNLFRAIGVIKQELRHSDFLAFLLNPHEAHNLGAGLIKGLLTNFELGEMPTEEILNTVIVERERDKIDLLAYTPDGSFVLLIENKVDSAEHRDQLQRYLDSVWRRFGEVPLLVALFLSPDGIKPSHDEYHEISYRDIIECLNSLIDEAKNAIPHDAEVVIRHYIAMVERYIVTDPELIERCQQIYRDYKEEIELIVDNAPDMRNAVKEYCTQLIQDNPDLTEDVSGGSYVRFLPREWDKIPELKNGSGWTSTRRLLLLEICVFKDQVYLKLTIGPAPETEVDRLVAHAQKHQTIFQRQNLRKTKWKEPYIVRWLQQDDMLQDFDYIKPKIDEAWQRFISTDLPAIRQSIVDLYS